MKKPLSVTLSPLALTNPALPELVSEEEYTRILSVSGTRHFLILRATGYYSLKRPLGLLRNPVLFQTQRKGQGTKRVKIVVVGCESSFILFP